MKRLLLLALLLPLLACGVKEHDLVGTWTGTVQATENKDGKDLVQNALNNVTISLELNEDKTFKTIGFEGAWSYRDGVLKLTPTKTLGFNISTPASEMTAQVAKDGKSFTLQGPFSKNETFVFKKATD
jgi:hypothetical protein